MKLHIIAALALPLTFGLVTGATANDAHHPEKQAKTKSSAKKAIKKPTKQVPPKKTAPSG